jgi:3-oxoacyl-[acyl-carrier-protein] synthase II
MDVAVTGIGLVTALGDRQQTWQHLLAGHTGIQRHQPFPELPAYSLGLIHAQPLQSLTALAQQIVTDAVADAGLTPPLEDCAVVIGSSRSHQAQWERARQQFRQTGNYPESSIPWLATLPQSLAVAIAQTLAATGPVLSPMAACATGTWALALGYELLQTGQCQRVIAGAIEAPITPLTLAGFQQSGVLASTGAYPFDRDREGLALAEGGAVLILEPVTIAQQRSAAGYGRILGFGLTADAHHISTPDPDHQGATMAVKHCLQHSQLTFEAIDYIHPHGTGTQLNDQMEAALIQKLFGSRMPVSSTKGATGHTLGASGALGAAFCLMALQQQILPPCVGLQHPAFDLEFLSTSRPAALRHALCFSFGFGGQNAAIALARSHE